ncbi:MAG: hypothetical protein JRJ84_23205, partial [Deltaproteobacteria bacterium]|nr:hypothetical protein [Deltaproteobacteria bacterium]
MLVAVRCQELPADVLEQGEMVLRPVTLELQARARESLVVAAVDVVDMDLVATEGSGEGTPATVEEALAPEDRTVSDATRDPTLDLGGRDDAAGSALVADREVPDALDPVPATPVAPEVERDEPAPDPEEPEPEDDEDPHMLRFVRVDEPAVSPEPPEEAEYISARDASHDHPSRAPVTEPDPGPRTPHEIGLSDYASRPALLVVEGDPADPTGEKPEVSEKVARSASDESGGGRKAHDLGAGAPEQGGDRRPGGAVAPGSGGSRTSGTPAGQVPRVAGPPVDGFQEGPEPEAVADVEAPEWWSPMATRRVTSPAAPPAPTPVVAVASPSQGDAVALVLSPGESSDRGGTAADADEAALPTEAEIPKEATGRQARAGASDPVEDLREALGWGGRDRSALQPRAAHAGARSFEGAVPTSPQAVVDEAYDLDRVSWVDAAETPLGRYTER